MGKRIGVGVVTLVAALLFGFYIQRSQRLRKIAPTGPNVESRYIEGYSESAHKPVVVVFVHGIFGDDTSWGSGDLALPHLMATDPSLQKRIDLFLFEYSSPWLRDAEKIPSLSEQLRGALDDYGVWTTHSEVIFVAHSMGGLVVRQYLIAHRDHIQKVPVLYFYGVPTDGAMAANVAQHLSNNPQLSGLVPLEGNNFLDAVTDDWLGSKDLQQLPTWCAFEDQDMDGIRIVPEHSAIALCTEDVPLIGDHVEIVKPQNPLDPRFTRLATVIKYALQTELVPKTSLHKSTKNTPVPNTVPITPSHTTSNNTPQTHSSELPWVGILDNTLKPPVISLDKNVSAAGFYIDVFNHGRSPAQHTRLSGRFIFPDPRMGINTIGEMKAECAHPTVINDDGPTVAPDTPKTLMISARTDFPGIQKQLNASSSLFGFFVGCVTYQDDLTSRTIHSAFLFDVRFAPRSPASLKQVNDFRASGLTDNPGYLAYEEVTFTPNQYSPIVY